jgi:hypothetical protein
MASASGLGPEPAEINADELYRRSSPEDDTSTRGIFADVVISFAGVLMILTSIMEIIQGMAAVSDPEFYSAGSDYLLQFNVTTWGWVHIVIGAVSVVVAVGVLRRLRWGYLAGLVVVGLSMLSNFAFLPHYPVASIVVIAIDVLIIWALLSALAREAREAA